MYYLYWIVFDGNGITIKTNNSDTITSFDFVKCTLLTASIIYKNNFMLIKEIKYFTCVFKVVKKIYIPN